MARRSRSSKAARWWKVLTKSASSRTGASCGRSTSWWRPAESRRASPRRRASSMRSRRTRSSICRNFPGACSWWAAATSRSNSRACSRGWARRSMSRCAPTTSCAASTRMCAQACATRSRMRASNSTSARCRHPTRRPADGLRVSLANGESLVVDQALVATGRRPHTAGLGLEKAGVELRGNGAVKVDALSRTSAPSVFAVGDVTDLNNLTPVAIREGHTLRRPPVRRQGRGLRP